MITPMLKANVIKRVRLPMSAPDNKYQDYNLLKQAADMFETNTYNILEHVMFICNKQLYINHLDAIFYGVLCGNMDLPLRYKEYIIAMLDGEEIFITNTEQAVLLA